MGSNQQWLVFTIFFVSTCSQIVIDDPDVAKFNIPDDQPDPSVFLADIHFPDAQSSFIHQISRSFLRVTKDILSLSPRTIRGQERDMTESLQAIQELNPEDVSNLLSEQGIAMPPSINVLCGPSADAYRTMDGSCNNLRNPCWGKSNEPYQRWLASDYANGIDEPRRRFDGYHLPSPRMVYQYVSSEFEPTENTQYAAFTNILVVWGQFLAHDILLTPIVTVKTWDGEKFIDNRIKCCNTTALHPDCLPLIIHHQDPYYGLNHCIEFVRSAAYSHRPSSCYEPILGQKRQQINQLTSFIDASGVYGTSESDMRNLREHNGYGAKLAMFNTHGRMYPPRGKNGTCKTTMSSCDKRCHVFGERRANENPALAALHTLFARHHNRLVDNLRSRGWEEETLFHVVRKIVGAQIQHIAYNEYIRAILGEGLTRAMNLSVPTDYYKYDSHLNPTIYNVFATAAFRYGHSMISNRQKRKGRDLEGSPVLSQDFFSMDDFCQRDYDPVPYLLCGLAEQNVQKVDCIFSKELTNHLFAKTPDGMGLDLFSINLQRGRDHGLPSYNQWRQTCGLKKARDYSDLRGEIPDYVLERLEAVYGVGRVDDVDLYVAGISEYPVNNGMLGPTFTCLVANQFRNLKFGDRFWYENVDHTGAFSLDQLKEIRKTTLSSIICENSETDSIQRMVFLAESSFGTNSTSLSSSVSTKIDGNWENKGNVDETYNIQAVFDEQRSCLPRGTWCTPGNKCCGKCDGCLCSDRPLNRNCRCSRMSYIFCRED